MAMFTKIPVTAVQKADREAAAAKKKLDDLKKAKGDKKAIAALEKEYAALAKTVVQIATKDMKTAAEGLKTLEKEVEGTLGAASKRLAAARTALKTYAANKDAKVLAPCFGLKEEIERLQLRATNLMDDYAVSWNDYRQLSFSVDAKLLKDIYTVRKTIIDRTIGVRGKQQKVGAVALEAGTVETQAHELTQGFETDSENRFGQLVEIRKEIENVIKEGGHKNKPELIGLAVTQFEEWLALPFAEFKKQMPIRKAQYKSLTTVGQVNNQAVSSMKRTIANGKKLLTPADLKDDKVKRVVKEIDDTFTTYSTRVSENLTALPKIATLLTQGDKRLKTGK
jgi:hypothetical protein